MARRPPPPREAVEGVLRALPLVLAKLIDTEIMELQPLSSLAL